METDMFLGNPDYYTIEKQKDFGMWEPHTFPAVGMIPYLKRLGEDLIGIEIGVRKAENACILLESLPNIKRIYGVDDYTSHNGFGCDGKTEEDWTNYHDTAITNIQPFWDRFTFAEYRIESITSYFEKESVDFILLDDDYSYGGVLDEITQTYPLLKRGGYLFINETHIEDVKKAVIDYRADNKIRIPLHTSRNNVMFWQKS